MFRNSYHPVFIIGGFCFAVGISFLSLSSILYTEIFGVNSYRIEEAPNIYESEDFWIWIGFLITGLTFSGSGLGIMKGNTIARNIAVVMSFACLTGLVILAGVAMFNLSSTRRTVQILALFGFGVFFFSILLSIIFILTGNDAREYFGEDKINEYEDLLDDI